MRKYYIDNLRILCILMLFPYHASMIYNNWGYRWYLHGEDCFFPFLLGVGVYPWWMSLLFVMAGMTTMYALKRRTIGAYAKERIHKLLIPLLSGLLLIVPVQTYIADIFYNGYQGNYFEHYRKFFVLTTWEGNDGHFTPGHLWFILYLFLVSMIALPFISWYQKRKKKIDTSKVTVAKMIPLFLLITAASFILNIGGKSMGEYTCCFLLGYFLLSEDAVQEKLKEHWKGLLLSAVILMLLRFAIQGYEATIVAATSSGVYWVLDGLTYYSYEWIGILAVLALGNIFLNRKTKFTEYFSPAAFPLYYFHQSVMVVVGYFVLKHCSNIPVQYVLIIVITFAISVLLYEICSRIGATRFLFGIKKK